MNILSLCLLMVIFYHEFPLLQIHFFCLMHHTTKSKGTKKHFKPIFSDTTTVHYYNTRYSSSNNFYIKKSCREIRKRAFSRVGAKICDEMPASLREPTPPPPPPPLLPPQKKENKGKKSLSKTNKKTKKSISKTNLHCFVVDILKNHDDYIDFSQIIST